MNEQLIKDPAKRTARAAEKEHLVLRFLIDEIFSTSAILAAEMGIGERGARNVLNRMEKKGLLVKDEVRFMAMRASPVWGITMNGVMDVLTTEEVSTFKIKYHTPGRIKPTTVMHTLDVQRCRQHCLRNGYKDWVSERFLPAQNQKKSHPQRWPNYPDGLVMRPTRTGGYARVSVEIERTRKTPARYVQIIRGHIENIEKDRYRMVMYYCVSEKAAISLKALFLRLMEEKRICMRSSSGDIYGHDKCIQLFSFKSIEEFEASPTQEDVSI